MDLVLAVDFGTSAVKAGIGGPQGGLIACAAEPYPLHLGPGGRAEQHPEDWWQALCRAIARLAAAVPGLKHRVGALSVCAQTCGLICADAEGRPLRPAIIWLDVRAAELTRRLVSGFPPVHGYGAAKLWKWARLANGAPSRNGMDPVSKMLWIARDEPEVFAATHRFLDVKDWIVHRASGTFCTTADSANLTWLMDTRPGREGWSKALARMAGLGLERMPPIVEGSSVAGTLSTRAATELGLAPTVRVMAGSTDIAAAALGSGAVEDGVLHVCAATGGWIGGFLDRRVLSPASAYATIISPFACRPLLVAAQEAAGSVISWAARITGALPHSAVGDERIAAAFEDLGDPQSGDPFLLPWHAGERVPLDDARLRGVYHGLTLAHDGRVLRRAALEGVALNLAWAFRTVARRRGVRQDTAVPLVGGVATLPAFCRLMADALNRTVETDNPRYSGVLGALHVAAPEMGWARDVWSAAARTRAAAAPARYDPDPARVALMAERADRLNRLRPGLITGLRRSHPETAG